MATRWSKSARAAVAFVVPALALAALAATTVTSPATAGSSTFNLSQQTFPDGRKVVARWNPCQEVVTFKVNPRYAASTPAGRKRAVSDVRRAVSYLSGATGIRFRFDGRTSQIPKNTSKSSWSKRQNGAEIVVAWVKQSRSAARTDLLGRSGSDYAAGSGGYAYKFWKVGGDPWRGATGRGFVVLDSAQNKKFAGGFGSGTTRGELLLHELGHVVGLNHVPYTTQVMYPTIRKGHGAGYAAGDLAGLERLGRGAGCTAVPGWVWTDLS